MPLSGRGRPSSRSHWSARSGRVQWAVRGTYNHEQVSIHASSLLSPQKPPTPTPSYGPHTRARPLTDAARRRAPIASLGRFDFQPDRGRCVRSACTYVHTVLLGLASKEWTRLSRYGYHAGLRPNYKGLRQGILVLVLCMQSLKFDAAPFVS